MKKFYYIAVLIIFLTDLSPQEVLTRSDGTRIIIFNDHTWQEYIVKNEEYDFDSLKDGNIPGFLRDGMAVQFEDLKTAVEMHLQGWKYTMPVPKSPKASWRNNDGRTTWYFGYWFNEKTGKYSDTTPEKMDNGQYMGDQQNNKGKWRNGGSPNMPKVIEWLLSENGGIKPGS